MEGCRVRHGMWPADTTEPATAGANCLRLSLLLIGTLLGVIVSPWFLLLSGVVGVGLVHAGVSGTCGMATLLDRLPYNQRA